MRGEASVDKKEKYLSWLLLLVCLGLVCWIRLLPLSLPVAEDWAEEVVRRRVGERLAQERAPASLASPAHDDLRRRVDDWVAHHRQQFAAEKGQVAQRFKARLRYQGEDGREYVYLGDYDSYAWLRNARNYLRTGTTCDAVVDGACVDTHTHAPVGSEMQYNRSPHIVAIVALHTFITFFFPQHPLPASAFLVPVLVGLLGVPPAFFLGRCLGGSIGGLFAALLSALYHQFLVRSMGGDNDVWNVVLPLYILWALVAALYARAPHRQALYGALAGGVCGLHAVTWQGWKFFFIALLSGLLGSVFLYGLRYLVQRRTVRLWQSVAVRKTALVLGAFFVAANVCMALALPQASSLEAFSVVILPVMRALGSVSSVSVEEEHPANNGDAELLWPSNFSTVSELLRPDLAVIVDSFWGGILFCGSLLGLLLLLLPKAGWRWRHWAVLCGGFGLFAGLVIAPPTEQRLALGLGMAPFVVAALSAFFDDEEREAVHLGFAFSAIFWFFGAWFLSYHGIRFLILLAPPFALGCAVTAGRLFAGGRQLVRRMSPRHGWVADPLLLSLLVYFLIDPFQGAHIVARKYVPAIEDAWWDTLTKIRDESSPEAIINTWWDYGYWAKYVAERRVSHDGGSLRTHIPHWLGKALVTPDETESIGVLRMLNCGSDALPYPEGQRGAYAQILSAGYDPIAAHDMLMELVRLDRAAAQAYLSGKGLSSAQQEGILNATHCTPPESYLVVASEQLLKPNSWMHLGLWNFRRAYVVGRSRFLPQADAVADLSARFGYSADEAARLYTRAQTLSADEQERNFIAPLRGSLSLGWISCQSQPGTGKTACPVGVAVNQAGSILDTFSYNPAAPGEGLFHPRHPESVALESRGAEGTPGVVLWADGHSLRRVAPPSPTFPQLGVMVDVPNQRIIIGSPPLVQSTFVQLLYLDGRYAKHYEKFDERATRQGTRVVTWKIHWDGRRSATLTPPGAPHNPPQPSAPRQE